MKTIYRTFKKGGDTIALFPEIPADLNGDFCSSYQQIGQHGSCSPMGTWFCRITRPATPEEIIPLEKELLRIGYEKIVPVKRISFKMHKARRENLNKF
jgi:hypothetical protein